MKNKIIIGQLFLLISSVTFTGLVAAACSGAEARHTLQSSDTEVLDNNTGLVWKRCSEGLSGTGCTTGAASTSDWKVAVELASGDWRLPNVKELASLLESQCSPNAAINIDSFPATSAAAYWTASPDRNVAANAWQVNFAAGAVSSVVKTNAAQVRLVKDQ